MVKLCEALLYPTGQWHINEAACHRQGDCQWANFSRIISEWFDLLPDVVETELIHEFPWFCLTSARYQKGNVFFLDDISTHFRLLLKIRGESCGEPIPLAHPVMCFDSLPDDDPKWLMIEYLFVRPSVRRSVCQSTNLSFYQSINQSIIHSIYIYMYQSINLSIIYSIYIYMYIYVSIYLSISLCLSVSLSLCLSVCLSVCLAVCLSGSVCLALFVYLYLSLSSFMYVYLSLFTFLLLSIVLSLSIIIHHYLSLSIIICPHLSLSMVIFHVLSFSIIIIHFL